MVRPIRMSKMTAAQCSAAVGVVLAGALFSFFPAFVYPADAQALYPCFSQKACVAEIDQGGAGGDFEPVPACPTGRGYCYAVPKVFNNDTKKWEKKEIPLIISIGGRTTVANLSDYISTVYNYGVSIAVIVAAVMMMIGGFRYLTAGGDAGKVSQGKENIKNALVGLILAFGAWMILNTINPDMVKLRMPRLPIAQKQEFAACFAFEGEEKCGVRFELEAKEGVSPEKPDSEKFTMKPSDNGTCTGKNCKKSGAKVNARCREESGLRADQKSQILTDIAPVNGYVCATCKADGVACSPDGQNDDCCTGFCGSGACRTGENGSECNDTGAACKSGLCQTRFGNSCANGSVGAPCDNDTECRGGNVCVERTGWFICVPPKKGSGCNDKNDCGGQECFDGYCSPEYCKDVCSGANNKCAEDFGTFDLCTDGALGSPCDDQKDCNSGLFCITDAVTGGGGVCGDGAPGSRCDNDTTCKPAGQADGKGHCVNHNGDYETCTSGAEWSPCDSNNDCQTGKTCNTSLRRCEGA